ncbi:MAG TPA: copper-binding protein [Thermoanaerobaculia bacterium]|nr:copper-binding protein [Thermoanaerobaculia bacterium]
MTLPVRLRAAAATFAAAAALALACSGAGDGGDSGSADGGDGVHRYDVRGVVVQVPNPADPLSNLVIRHEAIDGFRALDGSVVGMDSMSMPFPVTDAVDLSGVEPGDKVDFTLEVEWEGEPPYRIARLAELPPDTELEYREATPPSG